jgi:hypothetical protein
LQIARITGTTTTIILATTEVAALIMVTGVTHGLTPTTAVTLLLGQLLSIASRVIGIIPTMSQFTALTTVTSVTLSQ